MKSDNPRRFLAGKSFRLVAPDLKIQKRRAPAQTDIVSRGGRPVAGPHILASKVSPKDHLGSTRVSPGQRIPRATTSRRRSRPGGSKHYNLRMRTSDPWCCPPSLPFPTRLSRQRIVSGRMRKETDYPAVSGLVLYGYPALGASSLAARARCSAVSGSQPASWEGCAEEGGAERQEVSNPPEPRETRASSVTAPRPPCQRVGLKTDPAPSGSPSFASDSQVRRGRA